MEPLIHPDFVAIFPGSGGRMEGREPLLAGFDDFCQNARVLEYREDDLSTDAIGTSGVVSYTFSMDYQRSGSSYRATGRDLWVFQHDGQGWKAIWRTMSNLAEQPL